VLVAGARILTSPVATVISEYIRFTDLELTKMPKKDAGLCTVILIEQFTVSILVGTPVMSDPTPT
jgi:hypothetical protein